MNQLNLVAVPNGVFGLDEILKTGPMKKFVEEIKSVEDAETNKIKVFLVAYQISDTLAQMKLQGFDKSQVNMNNLKESIKVTIELGYEMIMKTFSNHERKTIRELFRKTIAN
ncbi:hypothetical protein B9Z45_02155 [Limnohabitans sp. 2KL-17]|uniref:hypothetical protein n=1 Tax=Limnohabitans sp. 2KL-17 TaxID=1100704 RepID=UPI000D39D3CB|nr:hypothetical protein [Limnohabitans sp. 2KL-17]PUE62890.1 hypothetical protein B9Z45_02155 [Limnohabitans sp. 2KL-17]